jgi:hypothetical protein
VLVGSRVGARGDRLKVYFYCFQSLYYWNMIGFVETLIFPNGLKLGFVSFRFFEKCWKVIFFEHKGLQA